MKTTLLGLAGAITSAVGATLRVCEAGMDPVRQAALATMCGSHPALEHCAGCYVLAAGLVMLAGAGIFALAGARPRPAEVRI